MAKGKKPKAKKKSEPNFETVEGNSIEEPKPIESEAHKIEKEKKAFALTNIRHNGVQFKIGDEIFGIQDEQKENLLKSNSIEIREV